MAQQVKIANATYNDVPSILCPDANGVLHPFTDTSVTTATANDVLTGKQFIDSAGNLVSGLLQLGLEYETGVWSPASNTGDAYIPFSKTHSDSPFFYLVSNSSGAYSNQTNTNHMIMFANYSKLFATLHESSSTQYYGRIQYVYRGSNASTFTTNGSNCNANAIATYSKNDSIRVYTGSTSRYWRTGINYGWIAVWAPTS